MELKLKLNLNVQVWNRFQVGAEFTKNDIEKFSFQYTTPTTWNIGEIFQAAKTNLVHDFQMLQKWVKNTCIYTKYVVSEIWRDRNFMYVILIASSPIVFGLTHAYNANVSAALPKPTVTTVLTAEKVEAKKTKHLEKQYKIAKAKEKTAVKAVKKEHTELMKELGIEVLPTKKKVEKPLVMVCNEPIATLPKVQVKKVETIKPYISKLPENIKVDLKEVLPVKEAKANSNLLLSLSEGFYPIPYWDNKQYSIGYGSYISKTDCAKIWERAGLSYAEGEKLAFTLHSCGYKRANQIIKNWINHPGVLTKAEAVEMREKEYSKFEQNIEEKFTFLPHYQKHVLIMTVYNTGFAGFYGGKFDAVNKKGQRYIKTIPKSRLAYCLEHYDWWDNRVYEAYTQLKTYNQGLMNRRTFERDAFFSTVKKDCNIAHNKKLEEAVAFVK